MKTEDAIAWDLARELFGTEPDDEMVAIARATIAFRFAVLDARRQELGAALAEDLAASWAGRLLLRMLGR